jgi:serine/threonine-protein kinase
MKKLIPFLFMVALALQACGSGNAAPTALSLPTAAPTNVVANATPKPSNQDFDPGEERVAEIDGMPQVYVPAGNFRMGGVDTKAQPDEGPDHSVSMKAFWMDKVEVTNGMYKLCVNAGVCEPPRAFQSATHADYFTSETYNTYPVVNVGWGDAKDYCEWAGRRLPTEAEWEYAARGSDYRTWPWGEERPDSSRANFNFLVADTSPVGQYPSGASPFGVLDMSGNVWEWVSDYYDPGYYAVAGGTNPPGPQKAKNGFRRVIRGGSWKDGEFDIRLANRGFAEGPDFEASTGSDAYLGEAGTHIGFRCVTDN